MKYCSKCGTELQDSDIYCPKCGAKVGNSSSSNEFTYTNTNTNYNYDGGTSNNVQNNNDSTLLKVGFAFGIVNIVACVFMFFTYLVYYWPVAFCYLIPLFWDIPMVIYVYKAMKDSSIRLSTAFKVCYLLFVNLIGGICLLCIRDN
jgi:hypothetical protein